MKILLVADIHANWPALQAIQEPHDICLFLGDLVDYGLDVTPCIDWVRRKARYAVRGNHDHGAVQNVTVTGFSGFKYLTGATRPLTRERLNPKDRRFLANLPVSWMATINDLRFLMVHGTPRDPLDEYAAPDADFWARRLEGIDADVVCVGHTHIPFVLEVGNKLVVNPGSVGLPRDGDPRASYAVIQGTKVEIQRIDYPIEIAVKSIEQSTLADPAKELLTEVYRTGSAKSQKVDSKAFPSKTDGAVARPKLTFQGVVARPRQTSQGLPRASESGPNPIAEPPQIGLPEPEDD